MPSQPEDFFALAKMNLICRFPFFANMAMRRSFVEGGVASASISAQGNIVYRREYVEQLGIAERVGLLVRLMLHYAAMDTMQVGSRDRMAWAVVCDAFVREQCRAIGLAVGPGLLSVDLVNDTRGGLYDRLIAREVEIDPLALLSWGCPLDFGGGCGNETSVRMEIMSALVSTTPPPELVDYLHSLTTVKIRWDDALRAHLARRPGRNSTWKRIRRSSHALPCVLPGHAAGKGLDHMLVGLDGSGSVASRYGEFLGCLAEVVRDVGMSTLTILCGDTDVYHSKVVDMESVSGSIDVSDLTTSSGGTDLRCFERYTRTMQPLPSVAVWLTDGETPWPEVSSVPLFVVTTKSPAPEQLATTLYL